MQTLHIIAAVVLSLLVLALGYGIYQGTISSAKDNVKDSQDDAFGDDKSLGYFLDTRCLNCGIKLSKVSYLPRLRLS